MIAVIDLVNVSISLCFLGIECTVYWLKFSVAIIKIREQLTQGNAFEKGTTTDITSTSTLILFNAITHQEELKE